MFAKTLLAAGAMLALTASAQAAQPIGLYGGVAVTHDSVGGSGDSEGFGASGLGGSVFAGYNLPMGANGFFGIEGNIDLNTADVEVEDIGEVEADWGWGIGARLGYSLSDSTNLYGRAGYQRNRIKGALVDGESDSAWGDGIRFGAGIETSVGATTALRFEFNHVNYEDDMINNQAVVGLVFGF